jgi:hypothetical protein
VIVLLAAPLPRAGAQQATDSSARAIAPGVTLRNVTRPDGPWVIHALRVDLRNRDLAVRAARACDRLTGRERPSALSKRLNASGEPVIAAINAGFFDLEGGSGATVGNVVVDGEIAQASGAMESAAGRPRPVRSQLAIEANGRPVIARFRLTGSIRTPRGRWPLAALNEPPAPDAVTLYTEWSQRPPRVPGTMRAVSIPLALQSRSGDTLRYRVIADGRDTTSAPVERGLVVGTGSAAAKVAALRAGDRVTAVATLTPDGTPRALVTGWPAIVRDGRNLMETLDSLEGASKGFATTRHPRSAVGISRGGDTLLLVAVDGRQASSVGMSLAELARTMLELGAWNALNLDGGGSTVLVVNDSVVSSPSDPTGERAVGDVLLVTRSGATTRSLPALASVPSCVLSGARDPDR